MLDLVGTPEDTFSHDVADGEPHDDFLQRACAIILWVRNLPDSSLHRIGGNQKRS